MYGMALNDELNIIIDEEQQNSITAWKGNLPKLSNTFGARYALKDRS